MRRLILIIIALVTSSVTLSAQNSFNKLFDECGAAIGYTTIEHGQKMIKMMSKQTGSSLNGVESIKIISTKAAEAWFQDGLAAVVNNGYEMLSSQRSNGVISEFFVKEINGGKTEFISVSIDDKKYVVISIRGRFSIESISKLSDVISQ